MLIGYLILAHEVTDQLFRLIERLDRNAQIHLHISLQYKSNINIKYLTYSNLYLSEKRYYTYWGGFGLLLATIELMKKAYNNKCDYFILLSGQCYPAKSNKYITDFINLNKNKNIIEINELPIENMAEGGYYKFKNYYYFDNFNFVNIEYKKVFFKYYNNILGLLNIRKNIPRGIMPAFGSQWWGLNRKAVRYILDFINTNSEILNYFKYTWAPDELFIQTVLANSPLKENIINRPFRYIDWNTNGPPKILTIEDYERIKDSGELFARKYDPIVSKELIEKLDKENKQ